MNSEIMSNSSENFACQKCASKSPVNMFNQHAAPTGWGYITGQGDVGKFRRFVWTVLMLGGISYSSYMIYDNAVRYVRL